MGIVVALGPRHAIAASHRSGTAPRPSPASTAPPLEPKAIDVLKAMSARLAAAKTMTFTAVATYESPSVLGPALAYTTISDVFLQRPDKLCVVTPGDGPASEFYYDGKTMTAYAPAENLAAVADAPPSIDGALKAAYDTAAIYFPFSDFVVSDPYGDVANVLVRAFYVGQSRVVGGTATDIVAIATDGVFAQLWIGVDDKLPRMIRAVFKNDPLRLRNQVELSKWALDVAIPPDRFTAAKAANATRIDFARPDPQLPKPLGPATRGTRPGKRSGGPS